VSDDEADPEAARARRVAYLKQINQTFFAQVPHNVALGMEITELEPRVATCRVPYAAQLVGNPETGVIHGGVITTLMDAACGAAIFMSLEQPRPIATLDLRIDYLSPATPHRDVFARAHCLRVTRNVAFVRGVAFHDDEAQPIASAAATFMLGTRMKGRPEGTR
jgi:uncharacterized protein (TIGR00369 family)